MKLFKPLLILLLGSYFLVSQAGGTAEETQQLPDGTLELTQLLQPLTGLSARFEQTVYAADGYQIQQTSGTLQVARPGKVHWVSDAPMEQWVIADGETLWIYDPDLEQVTIRAFQKDIANTPAILFVGALDKLSESYQVLLETSDAEQQFTLLPLDSNSLYSKLQLAFVSNTPVSMSLWDTLGQQTAIRFLEPELNPEMDPDIFAFVPPDGVDILRDE